MLNFEKHRFYIMLFGEKNTLGKHNLSYVKNLHFVIRVVIKGKAKEYYGLNFKFFITLCVYGLSSKSAHEQRAYLGQSMA